ncbi:Outer membrane protein beta-barrel domain-containing protein [Flaviramulus basaltis]|uniref:Outer membrane protein beta-barrel domain-containing protein n=1 Tax=Flaviramulus basaltis TaxID=369401 RepID=A0A1K2IGQ8_9FLAO|nr:porin family protein [Flaviramulus basaltis]SFZ91478.1 Outer membrane protein beta-barrel domain-containing protein [Flaviramulus basaltis]
MNKILLLAILFGFSLHGFTQDKDSIKVKKTNYKESPKSTTFQGVKYGVRGGYNISNLDFDGASNAENKHRNSIYIGFFANIGLSRTISVVPEIQFSAEGANEEVLNLDYIQAPIFLRFRLSEKIHAGFGPQVGLKVHKYEDGIRNFAYSGVAGIDYKINYAIFLDARYTYGFSNIFDNKLGIKAKNTNLQLGVGYKF